MDKGTGVVVMDSDEYYSKLDVIVNDSSKFKKLSFPDDYAKASLIISKQRSVSYYVNTYLKDDYGFDKKFRANLTQTGCQPGKLYGQVKVHKPGHPLRPVVSMIGTPEYELAKFLDTFIKPNIPNDFMLSSTSEFIDKLKFSSVQGHESMVSFDVCSLFTNVPLLETINIVVDRVYGKDSVIKPPFKKLFFKKMLIMCSSGLFMYNDEWYEQIDGVAMGSPLASSLANMFLAHIEHTLLMKKHTLPPNFPKLSLRYVDDIFCLFECKDHHEQFLHILNSLHPSLQFTVEVATTSLPFLDVRVKIDDNNLETSVYRKSTHTGVFLNYQAIAPTAWKRGLIWCLLHRAKMICSSLSLFWEEVDVLRHMFTRNGYTHSFFDLVCDKFMQPKPLADNSILSEPEAAEAIPFCLFKVPYYGKSSGMFAKTFKQLVEDNFKVDLRVIFTTNKVGSSFSLKSRSPSTLWSNVVYCFTCAATAHLTYIGYTSRHLSTRAEEHTDLTKNTKSHVRSHILSCDGCKDARVNFTNFEVLKHYSSEMDCKVGEALAIKKHRPHINKQLFANGASLILNVWN